MTKTVSRQDIRVATKFSKQETLIQKEEVNEIKLKEVYQQAPPKQSNRKIGSTREIVIFESNQQKTSTAFRWTNNDHSINTFKLYCYGDGCDLSFGI